MIGSGRGVAVRAFVMKPPHGRADDILFLDGRPVGIVEAKPDFVFNTINGSSNVGFIKAYYEQGLTAETTPIISVSIAEEEAPAMGHSVTGQYAAWNYFQSVESPTNAAFIKAFQDKYGANRPTSDPMEAAYTSLHLYKAIVEKAG